MKLPQEVEEIPTVAAKLPDDVLIVAASWEQRCFGSANRMREYRCSQIVLTVYNVPGQSCAHNIAEMERLLTHVGPVERLPATFHDPLDNVRNTIERVRDMVGDREPRMTIDVTSFTRKHLLLLVQGLDLAGLLKNCQFIHTEPADFHTTDIAPISHGLSSVKAIETFAGNINPSRDTILLLFLGYEGQRTLALWEHLSPNITLAVVPYPPYKTEWVGRTEAQNRYLLSCLPQDRVYHSHSLRPADTDALLESLIYHSDYSAKQYNYLIAPMGTKAQTLGIYRFWRKHRGVVTVMYAAPIRYLKERTTPPAGRTWVLDRTDFWESYAAQATPKYREP